MTPQPQYDLRPTERPISSDYARERSYARRRVITLLVVALVGVGVSYIIWGRGASKPSEIPTIKAEGDYKQKPVNPGGIDIPHQDVRVYDALETKGSTQLPVEHLLPPPEIPQEPSHPLSGAAGANQTPAKQLTFAPTSASDDEILSEQQSSKAIATTVTPAPVAALSGAPPTAPAAPSSASVLSTPPSTPIASVKTVDVARPAQSLSMEQVIEHTKSQNSTASTSKPSPAVGECVIQLASSPDENKAQGMVKDLQQKYSAQLNGASLHLTRAELPGRGTFYRIQSQSLTEDAANQICSALKQLNAGCILVRK